MNRWRGLVMVALVGLLGGCAQAGGGSTPGGSGLGRLQQQAHDALARYDQAVDAAGGLPRFVPVGELTGQIGTWEASTGDNNKLALASGHVVAVVPLPPAPRPTGQVRWDSGVTQTVPLIAAGQALAQLVGSGGSQCGSCEPIQVTAAELGTTRIQTTRGPAVVPAWVFTLRGTTVRVTRVAVAPSATITVTPPSWDPFNPPGGIAIESATTSRSSQELTVTFTGAPDPASQPCGADYTGQAVESANAVVVIVIEHSHAAGETCAGVGANRTATVTLAKPLGERAVLEVQQGLPVPVTIT
jgi:hypothetical protein